MKTFAMLLKNELKLNIRNMNMVIFAVILPLIVLAIPGLLYGTAPAAEGADFTFLEQSIGALCAISICAGGLMGLPLVVSEYRERKILKRFQVTPVSPATLLAVELFIYVLYAAVSLATLLPAAMLLWQVRMRGSWPAFLGSWLLTAASTLSIGMMVGGIAKNAKTASVIACILYFPHAHLLRGHPAPRGDAGGNAAGRAALSDDAGRPADEGRLPGNAASRCASPGARHAGRHRGMRARRRHALQVGVNRHDAGCITDQVMVAPLVCDRVRSLAEGLL